MSGRSWSEGKCLSCLPGEKDGWKCVPLSVQYWRVVSERLPFEADRRLGDPG